MCFGAERNAAMSANGEKTQWEANSGTVCRHIFRGNLSGAPFVLGYTCQGCLHTGLPSLIFLNPNSRCRGEIVLNNCTTTILNVNKLPGFTPIINHKNENKL